MANDDGPPMIIVMVVLTTVSFIFMTLRFYCKLALGNTTGSAGIDDMVLAFSFLLFLVFVVLSIYCTTLGLGKRMAEVDMTKFPELMVMLPISQFFAVVSVAASKSSFIITLLRLVVLPWQKAALWFMLVTINLSMGSISIVQFFQCGVPPAPGCVPGSAVIGLGVFAAGYSAVMDLVLTAFPFLVIWNLQMKKREKVGVIASMSLGVVAGVIGIYKSSTIPAVSRSLDFTHGTVMVLIWLVGEVTATIIACSIPFLRPLVRRISSSGKASKDSYALSNRGHNKLGSRSDIKGPEASASYDQIIDKDVQPLNTGGAVRRTDTYTVEFDAYSADGVNNGPAEQGQVSRREMC